MATATLQKKHDQELIESQCFHDYKLFKQAIKPTNPSWPHNWHAYHIVQGCLKCHKKNYLDYKVDKG